LEFLLAATVIVLVLYLYHFFFPFQPVQPSAKWAIIRAVELGLKAKGKCKVSHS
jgi:hypothetical protein